MIHQNGGLPGPPPSRGRLMSYKSMLNNNLARIAGLLIALTPIRASAQIPFPKSPTGVQAYYFAATTQNRNLAANATGTFVFLVWDGPSAESDTTCSVPDTTLVCTPLWQGYRVRRSIEGISPGQLEVVGQWKARDTVTSICLDNQQPCAQGNVQDFVFTGPGSSSRGSAATGVPTEPTGSTTRPVIRPTLTPQPGSTSTPGPWSGSS